jgi:YegS/Rv2252/BmrU family lipid kinase
MQSKTSIQFIINPISGTIKKQNLPELFERLIDRNLFDWEIKYTNARGHATEIAKQAVADKVNTIVAVGGDGTINEVAKSLIHSEQSTLGIIPLGSGNGLARHLKIPLSPAQALKVILDEKRIQIDTCKVNNVPFFCTSGVGFDATVSHYFDQIPGRGLYTYITASISKYFAYTPEVYQIEIDGKKIEKSAFIVSVANASQYGNNAYISPNANISDGLMDLVVMKKFAKPIGAWLIFLSFAKLIDKSSYLEIVKGKQISIKHKSKLAHIDGDPIQLSEHLKYEIEANSLWVKVSSQT